MSDSSARCACLPVVETRFGGAHGAPSTAIVEAVAAAEGVAVTDLAPLYETVDPGAVDRLFADPDDAPASRTLLRFSVSGWNVFVRGDGAVRVCDPDTRTEPASAFEKPLRD